MLAIHGPDVACIYLQADLTAEEASERSSAHRAGPPMLSSIGSTAAWPVVDMQGLAAALQLRGPETHLFMQRVILERPVLGPSKAAWAAGTPPGGRTPQAALTALPLWAFGFARCAQCVAAAPPQLLHLCMIVHAIGQLASLLHVA